jgi:hypothetical protein
VAGRELADLLGGAENGGGAVLPLGPAGEAGQPGEDVGGDAVGRGGGPVVVLLLADEQGSPSSGEMKRPPAASSQKCASRASVSGNGLAEPARVEGGLVELEEAPREEGVVLGQTRAAGLPGAVAVQQAAALVAQVLEEEVCGPAGALGVGRFVEGPCGPRQRGDHQAVPVGEHLVVEERPLAAGPGAEERQPGLLEPLSEGPGPCLQAAGGDVEGPRGGGRSGRCAGGSLVEEVALAADVEEASASGARSSPSRGHLTARTRRRRRPPPSPRWR